MPINKAARNQVLIIIPPNSNTAIEGRLLTVTRPEEHSDWSDFLCLGALSLVSSLQRYTALSPIYIDGTIIDIGDIAEYITSHSREILAVCISALTANYEAGLILARHAKSVDSRIATIFGNDHFTALPEECMTRADCVDYGFVGNEVVLPFTNLLNDLYHDLDPNPTRYPSLATRSDDGVHISAHVPEPVYTRYNYSLVDEAFAHSGIYRHQFSSRIAPRVKELIGKHVSAGVPVDIGRGCVKFARNDACSFCSIQYGGLWRNSLTPDAAWEALQTAWDSGYDYLYLTADELPLTFGALLDAMRARTPHWWNALGDDRPVLVGYARADGIADERRTQLLVDLGVRQVMIGMDAGSAAALAALNKPLGGGRANLIAGAEALYQQNWQAISNARDQGLLIRAGFVLGHIGMTSSSLEEDVQRILALISAGKDIISAIDIEILSPQPGSLDFRYLTDPNTALAGAKRLGLRVADLPVLQEVANRWSGQDIVIPELAIRDYTQALMPDVSFDNLVAARALIRNYSKSLGIIVGE